jgi:hypothetical protein
MLWSSDSKSFVIVDNGNLTPFFYYVTHYATNVSKALLRLIALFKSNTGYGVSDIYDISSDSNRLVIKAGIPNPNHEIIYKLYIYDTLYPSNDELVEDFDTTDVIAASFAPHDESKLWAFTAKGIVQFDLVTRKTTLLDDTFTSIDALNVSIDTPAIFSPDGRYLATLAEGGLYLIDLTQQAAQLVPSPVTQTPETALLRLTLMVDCPASYTDKLMWYVLNPNPQAVTVTWQNRYSKDTGNLIVPAGNSDTPGEATFQVNAAPPQNSNVIDLFANGLFQDMRECHEN